MKKQQGFTLIELMIVVAIIAILAALAIPAYQDYTMRAQASEGITLSNGLKTSLAEYYATNGTWPTNNAALGITGTISGSYVSAVTTAGGAITATFGNKANTAIAGQTLTIRPAVSANGDVTWVCGTGAIPAGTSIVGTDGTSISAQYLPAACKP